MIEVFDAPESTESTLANDPIESSEAADPMLPMLSTEPMDPMLSTEFVEPMLSSELRERRLHREVAPMERVWHVRHARGRQRFHSDDAQARCLPSQSSSASTVMASSSAVTT